LGIRDLPSHLENPYMKAITQYKKGVKRTTVKGGRAIVDLDTGELTNVAEIVQIEEVDSEQFVKLYTADLKRFFSLTPTAQRLLKVVLEQVQRTPDADMITLNMPLVLNYFERTKDEKPLAKQTFYRCLGEMVNKGFLACSQLHTDQYFINPAIFFNGSRVRLVKEYQIKNQGILFL